MEKTSDTIVNELFKSLDVEVPHVSETESILSVSCAKLPKMHKKHKKSKKHKKHKKKSKKSKKSKKRSHSKCSEDSVELKIDKDKLEEVKSGMPVTLDAVLETIVVTANEESEEFQNNLCIPQKNSSVEEPSTKQTTVDIKDDTTNVSNTNSATINNNSKIVIKDLKGSRVYHDLLNKVHETEILEAEKYEEVQSSSCGMDINIKIKKGKHKSHKSKKKKRSRSRDRSRSSKRPKRDRSHSRNRKRSRSPVLSHKNDHVHNDFNGNSSSKHDSHRNHQHRSRSRDKNSSNSRGKKENRSRSQDKFEASKSTKRSRTPDYDTKEKISRFSRSREYEKTRRRSRSKDLSSKSKRHRSPSCEKIDKKKLFKIARKNALSLVQQGMLPVGSVKKETLANIPTKSVDELTDFCRKLSKKEKDHENESSSSMSEDETKQPFHHPFLVKDRPNIVLNIRNSTQLPVKSFQEKTVGQDMLRLQFPVSSGQTHSLAVNEWMPIGAEESAKLNKISRPSEIAKPNKTPNQLVPLKVVTVEPVQQTSSIQTAVTSPKNDSAPIVPQQYPAICEPTPISKNLYANSGYSMLSYETGQFTGHTGAKILTPAELATGYQPWVKKAILVVF
ncbi:protein Son isoform X2 [Adelges cooleyi]|uniref:protein Son isoform X2 n=1 Tax=Adelges cooleyi TaxID=133065 RepID=UPI00217FD3F8|nr:protein Son isoform X2 [Adelges cooleyi]